MECKSGLSEEILGIFYQVKEFPSIVVGDVLVESERKCSSGKKGKLVGFPHARRRFSPNIIPLELISQQIYHTCCKIASRKDHMHERKIFIYLFNRLRQTI
jgi:hypothetical protein